MENTVPNEASRLTDMLLPCHKQDFFLNVCLCPIQVIGLKTSSRFLILKRVFGQSKLSG